MQLCHIDSGGEGWLRKTASKNYWKVRHVYDDMNDLTQDGHLCWCIVANKYQEVTDYGHLMRLFQTTFYNHIRYVATINKDRDYQNLFVRITDLVPPEMSEVSEMWIMDRLLANPRYADVATPSLLSDSGVLQLVSEALEPVRATLTFLLSDAGIAAMKKPFRLRVDGSRETVNERLCRCLKLGPTARPLMLTKQYLAHAI